MEKKNREKRGARSAVALISAQWREQRGKRGQGGPGFSATWRGKILGERGPRTRRVTARVVGIGDSGARWPVVVCERERRKRGSGGIGR
jgi:hypothetical protein